MRLAGILCRSSNRNRLTDILNHKEKPYLDFEMVLSKLGFRLKGSFLSPVSLIA